MADDGLSLVAPSEVESEDGYGYTRTPYQLASATPTITPPHKRYVIPAPKHLNRFNRGTLRNTPDPPVPANHRSERVAAADTTEGVFDFFELSKGLNHESDRRISGLREEVLRGEWQDPLGSTVIGQREGFWAGSAGAVQGPRSGVLAPQNAYIIPQQPLSPGFEAFGLSSPIDISLQAAALATYRQERHESILLFQALPDQVDVQAALAIDEDCGDELAEEDESGQDDRRTRGRNQKYQDRVQLGNREGGDDVLCEHQGCRVSKLTQTSEPVSRQLSRHLCSDVHLSSTVFFRRGTVNPYTIIPPFLDGPEPHYRVEIWKIAINPKNTSAFLMGRSKWFDPARRKPRTKEQLRRRVDKVDERVVSLMRGFKLNDHDAAVAVQPHFRASSYNNNSSLQLLIAAEVAHALPFIETYHDALTWFLQHTIRYGITNIEECILDGSIGQPEAPRCVLPGARPLGFAELGQALEVWRDIREGIMTTMHLSFNDWIETTGDCASTTYADKLHPVRRFLEFRWRVLIGDRPPTLIRAETEADKAARFAAVKRNRARPYDQKSYRLLRSLDRIDWYGWVFTRRPWEDIFRNDQKRTNRIIEQLKKCAAHLGTSWQALFVRLAKAPNTFYTGRHTDTTVTDHADDVIQAFVDCNEFVLDVWTQPEFRPAVRLYFHETLIDIVRCTKKTRNKQNQLAAEGTKRKARVNAANILEELNEEQKKDLENAMKTVEDNSAPKWPKPDKKGWEVRGVYRNQWKAFGTAWATLGGHVPEPGRRIATYWIRGVLEKFENPPEDILSCKENLDDFSQGTFSHECARVIRQEWEKVHGGEEDAEDVGVELLEDSLIDSDEYESEEDMDISDGGSSMFCSD